MVKLLLLASLVALAIGQSFSDSMDDGGCGKSKYDGSTTINGRVQGGEEVAIHSIPWQVAILYSDGTPIMCGGTLISPSHVLTAAHCVTPNCSYYSIGVGMHTLDVKNGTMVRISHITNHPDYDPSKCTDNDFSIIHLASPVDIDDKVRPACLPDETMNETFLTNKTVTVSGWGYGSGPNNPRSARVLHKAQYPAKTNKECQELNGYFPGCITENMLCAGNPEDRTASHSSGDSGGPLTYRHNGRETIVGVVSWSPKRDEFGIKCDGSLCHNKLAVYARVTEKLQWIKDEMKQVRRTCPKDN